MQPENEKRYMEWDTAQRILRTGMVISFLVAALGIVGEVLGWWNDVGELLTTTGTVGGLVLGATSIIGNASRSQVDGVAESLEGVNAGIEEINTGVEDVNTGVEGVITGVEQANDTLGQIDEDLDKLDKLDKIEAALVAQDGQTSKLDVVQTELDRQTGVLDRQVGLLTEIRDRL